MSRDLPVKWDKGMIVRALLDRRAQGLELNIGAIQKQDTALASAIYKHFGSHDAALLAAGIDPESIRKAVRWDQARVVAALQARIAAGLAVNVAAVSRDERRLSGAIDRCFGSHDAALRAAGIDPRSARRTRPGEWDNAAVVAALTERRDQRLGLNQQAVEHSNSGLSRAARRCFGSHDAALRAAGIDPRSARPSRPGKWDNAAVIAALRERQVRGLGLNQNAVARSNSSLSRAARRCFGSHDAALRAAGIDPAPVRKCAPWDRDRVVKAIRSRRKRGLGLSYTAVARSSGPLLSAMAACFGTHDAALQAAGIDPASVRQRGPRWETTSVISALRDRDQRGLALNCSAVGRSHPSLDAAMRKLFPSYDAALRAAGFDPASTRVAGPSMPEHEIIAALRQRQVGGLALNVRAICGSDARLARAMRRGFGSHDAALRAAGIDPLSVRKRLPMTAEEILAALRSLARNGVVARPWVESANGRLRDQARSRFGSLEAAVEAAGLQYVRRCAASAGDAGHWTEQGVLKMLRDLHREGHDLRYRLMKESQPLFFAAQRLFGSYVNAVRQAGIDYWEMSQAQLAKDRAAATAGGTEAD